MANLFADTSGWANIVDPSQIHHLLAVTLYRNARQQGQQLIVTNYILTELVALLTSPLRIPRPNIVALVEGLQSSPSTQIVHIDEDVHQQAWDLLSKRLDKTWSLVDCSSFVIMQRLGIREALTTDHHFEQAGFVRLLK
ncbi:MAG: PIN domain-containing protein [Chloroflexota bacterium]|nr:PIN domain-containing protein [Chloroflexota bacterium]